jgi:hypothetical protein
MIIQIGRLLGKLKPNNRPVRIALPSKMVQFFLPKINFVMAHSKKTQETTDVASTIAAPRPKNHRLAIRAGTRAIHTPYIFFCTESPP